MKYTKKNKKISNENNENMKSLFELIYKLRLLCFFSSG